MPLNRRLWPIAVALLPLCFLSAQQPDPQAHPPARGFQQPSPEALRKATQRWREMQEHSIAIDALASHIRTLDDARKLVDMIADEFSDELPPKWATRSLRKNIARSEFASVTDPRALLSDEHVAHAWNNFVRTINAPQDTRLSATEIHYLRDGQYVGARLSWSMDGKQIWTIPGIFALGPDGKVASGSRAIEAIRLLWLTGSMMDDFPGIHTAAQKGHLLSDEIPHPEKPPAPGTATSQVSFRITSMPIQQAASQYSRTHGARALDHAVEDLLRELLDKEHSPRKLN